MRERGRLDWLRILTLGGLLTTAWGSLDPVVAVAKAQEGSVTEELDRLLDEGVALFRMGKDEEALAKFNEILAKEPTAEQAYRLRDRVESRVWILLLAKEGDQANVAKRILELAVGGERAHREDLQAIAKAVEDLRSEDYGVRRRAINQLVNQFSSYSVPALLQALEGSPDTEYRSSIAYTLSLIGRDAVRPLSQALKSSDPMLVKTAIGILSNVGDPRSAGALQSLAERSTDATVVDRARAAVERIPGAAGRPARDLWLELARRYYDGDLGVVRETGMTWPIWGFKDGAVTRAEVPRELYALRLAEDACHEALASDPTSPDARALLVRALVSQNHVSAASGGGQPNDANLARSLGPDAVRRAAEDAVADGDVPAAVGAVDALSAVQPPGSQSASDPLAAAVGSANRFVRYAAALALVKTTPRWSYPDPAAVVQNLIDAASDAAVRQVLVIEPDAEARRNLVLLLSEQGFFVIAEEGGLLGLVRAKRGAPPDLVILRNEIRDVTPDRVIRELRDDYRTAATPVLLTSDSNDLDKLKSDWGDRVRSVQPWPLPATGREVAEAVRAAMGEELNASRHNADVVAVAAAQALEALVTAPLPRSEWTYAFTDEDVKRLTEMCNKKDEIRTPIITVLGEIATSKHVATSDELRRLLADSATAAPVRAAAARSLGAMWGNASDTGTVPDDVAQALAAALSDPEASVARAAADGLGRAALSPEQRVTIYSNHRTPAEDLSGKKSGEADKAGDAPADSAEGGESSSE